MALTEKEEDIIELYYKLKKTVKDIAIMFDITEEEVERRLKEAKDKLR